MSLQARMLLYAVVLIALTAIAIAVPMALQTRQAILRQAEVDGRLVAQVMAQTAAVASTIPAEIEDAIGAQMVSEALLAAHLVDIAMAAGVPPAELSKRFEEITARTSLAEIWVTDETGRAVMSNLPDVDFQFSPDSAAQPMEHRFWPLLRGTRFSVEAPAAERQLDGRIFKYVGVRGVDQPRIVQVGYEFAFIEDLSDRIGLREVVRNLLQGGNVNAVWVFDSALAPLAADAVEADRDLQPDPQERAQVEQVIRTGQPTSWLQFAGGEPNWVQRLGWMEGAQLAVVAPISGADGLPIGAALLRLPTDELQRATLAAMRQVGVIVAMVLTLGLMLSFLAARRLSRPVLILTDAAGAIERGRFEAATLAPVIRRQDELGRLARVFGDMAREIFAREERLEELVRARTRELEEKNSQLTAAQAQINQELEVAQHMQQAILPATFPRHPLYAGYAEMTAARQIGGDFYDFFALDTDRIGVIIGDVSGKGVPAAFFMAVTRTILQEAAAANEGCGAALAAANDRLCQENPLELFVTVFYGILDSRSGRFTYANAGHNAPLILRHGGEVEELAGTGGMALGVMDGLPYAEDWIQLEAEDTVFLFTDGVTEAFNEAGEEFTDARLVEALRACHGLDAAALGKAVVRQVHAFAGAAPQSDDLTCLSLRWHGIDADETVRDVSLEEIAAGIGLPDYEVTLDGALSRLALATADGEDGTPETGAPETGAPVSDAPDGPAAPQPDPAAGALSADGKVRLDAFAAHTVIGTPLDPDGPMQEDLIMTLASRLEEIHRMSAALEQFNSRHDLTPDDMYHVELALDELITNIISYGYADDGARHDIMLRFTLEGTVLTVVLEDDGQPFNPLTQVADPDLEAEVEGRGIGGLGVYFVKQFMDGVEYLYEDGRNRLTIWKRVTPAGASSEEESA